MKELPTDIGTFSTIIENDYIYIDKTEFIYNMAKPGKKYFLSRPRRFGKSLLVSTLESLYSGRKELFKDLYIYDKWDWSKQFPVVYLDFSQMTYNSVKTLKDSINNFLNQTAEEHDIELKSGDLLTNKFAELIKKISKKYGQNVVVLIDEYDKAILDNINDLDLADEIRKELNSFYGSLKGDKFLEFIFITGVTKFTKTNIFSGLNNVTDLSFNPNYANICGYGRDDLKKHFTDRISLLAEYYNVENELVLKKIKSCYNGYSWNGKDFLYNPYSILSLFNEMEFNNFWFESGTPSFLMEYIKNNIVNISVFFNPNPIIKGKFPSFDIKNLDFVTLLLQSGYLTVKDKKIELSSQPTYKLGIPNKEVEKSLYNSILASYLNMSDKQVEPMTIPIFEAILNNDIKAIESRLNQLLGMIPHQYYKDIKDDIVEANYKMFFFGVMKSLGFNIIAEPSSHKGEIDFALKRGNLIVLIEMKHSLKSSFEYMLKEAITQIHNKKYFQPYLANDVVLLAVAIKDREVKCEMEILN
ncbi:MAG: ATP-binding protein [Methanobrevibacter sp.]|jgi:Holliday junction resolvase-like predicted endonuclease|nr:ATP-binding protein [Candidatus Methanoflexus mossambicus]